MIDSSSSGGKNGYKGYTYQTLVFLDELLNEGNVSGQLEKGDDFIINGRDSSCCYQTKDYSEPLKSSDIQEFIPNFFKSYSLGIRRFIVYSPFGAIKKLDLEKIYEKLFKTNKISDTEFKIRSNISINFIKKSRSEVEANLKLKIGDVIKSKGGAILSEETAVIAENLFGKLFVSPREFTRTELLNAIEKDGATYITAIPPESMTNSSDLVTKYKEEIFSKQICESAVHFLARFYFKRKKLSQNPSLQEKFASLYCEIQKSILNKDLKKLTKKEFEDIIKDLFKLNPDIEIENFIDSDNSILEEMYNSLIGECHFRPKNEAIIN